MRLLAPALRWSFLALAGAALWVFGGVLIANSFTVVNELLSAL